MKLSVVMSVYNSEKTIKESVGSILTQSYENFEFIIVNDGSTDNTENLLRAIDDERITILNNDGNKGITYSLNKGISVAKGDYIVRMDADDFSLPERFKELVKSAKENEDVDVFYSYVVKKQNDWKVLHAGAQEDEDIKIEFLHQSRIVHPSTMIKKEIFLEHQYSEKFEYAEDYSLWLDLIKQGKKFLCIPKALLIYNITNESICSLKHHEQSNRLKRKLEDFLKDIGISSHNVPYFRAIFQKDLALYYYLYRYKDYLDDLELISARLSISKEKLMIYHQEYRRRLKLRRLSPLFFLISIGKFISRKSRLFSKFVVISNKVSANYLRKTSVRSYYEI